MSEPVESEWAGQGRRVGKSAGAFRTISEVSGELDVPQHVLRFWETKFAQVRPMKRAGGRRYYRPEDVMLLRAIRDLLYREGYTIKGAQKHLRDGAGRSQAGEAGGARAGTAALADPPLPGPQRGRQPGGRAAAEATQPVGAAGSRSGAGADEEFTITRAELEQLIGELTTLRELLRKRGE